MFAMYKCGPFLVATDGNDNYTESLDAGPADTWRNREIFMMMNAQGMVAWTSDPRGDFKAAAPDIAAKIPGGKLIWSADDEDVCD